ncbi:MAG: hypothetical protein P4L10_03370 [Acidobacteriaceae bacterium]|jgi:hypothetical protein|nr:hypothetical protein [Acidobacteriaceae bacterium]
MQTQKGSAEAEPFCAFTHKVKVGEAPIFDRGTESGIVELSQAQLAQTQAQIEYDSAHYRYQQTLAALRFQTEQQY